MLGATVKIACDYAGISEATYYNYMARGREEADRRQSPRVKPNTKKWNQEQPFLEFMETNKKAIAQNALNNLAVINTAANTGTWQAGAWIMQHRHGYRQNTDITTGGKELNQPILYIKEDRSLLDDPTPPPAPGGEGEA